MLQPVHSSKTPNQAPYPGSGLAVPANVTVLGAARFSVLGAGLLRLEYQAQGRFEDRASYFAVRRDHGAQVFEKRVSGKRLEIETSRFLLKYHDDGQLFGPQNLSIQLKPVAGHPGGLWQPGAANAGNLGGTLRTLDECEAPLPLDPGVLSRDGWFLKDDSATVLFSDAPQAWAEARPEDAGLDQYFFAYGLDYPSALADLASLSGPIPLPPHYAFGAWYSRYWPYTAEEFIAIADEFRQRGFPLDVMVLDMDWHREGWTGYSWNHGLIPDPTALLRDLHARGLRTTMNLHPHDGVAAHEDAYPAFATAMGVDPASKATVPFDVTDPAFMRHYFELLLRPLEQQGVDFWWMDWQQGTETRIKGLDPLMWLNHLHFWDRQRPRQGALRGMNFSRWGGWGDQRYPVHFSGDTHANWEVLSFMAPFTASAGNVGVAYWSHDLGGHFGSGHGVEPELYLRWLQFGALSPVMRIHSSRDPANDRRPWLFGEQFTRAARSAFALRASLVPYLYSAAREAFDFALPLLRPMYLAYPAVEDAYHCPGQYLLGPDLLAVPAADPGHGPRKVVQVPVWFPEGDWYHWQTHQRFRGPLHTTVAVPLDGIALFARGGAAIPLNAPGHAQACASNGPRVLRVYPGPGAVRELYEDDGEGLDYAQAPGRRTRLSTEALGLGTRLRVGAPSDGSARSEWVLEAPRHFDAEGSAVAVDRSSLGPLRARLDAGPAGQSAEAELGLLADGLLAELYDRCLDQQQRALLGLDQLPQDHGLRPAFHDLAARADALINQFHGRAGLNAIQAATEALEQGSHTLLQALAQDPGAEAAARVLAGVSLLAFVDRGPDARPLLRLELRRDAQALKRSGSRLQAAWDSDGRAQAQELELGSGCVSRYKLPYPVDAQRLALSQGRLQVTIKVGGITLNLTEALDWNGRTVKDWAVLGPVDKALSGPAAQAQAWELHRFDPSRVAKGLRHFHDLGDAFHCPDQAVWAFAELVSAGAGEAQLELHHEGTLQCWYQGAELKFDAQRRARVALQAGANPLIVRLEGIKSHGRGLYVSAEADAALDLRSRPAAELAAALKTTPFPTTETPR